MNKEIIKAILNANGKPFLIGGAVRDYILNQPSKDWDIEVFNINTENLIDILSKFGKVDTVGKSFGIIKLHTKHDQYDFSLPRRENKQGQGHKGFIVNPDPNMIPEEAASRRDFTINAMMLNLENNTILDPFNGQIDLKNNLLKHTSTAFAEDPLRVLRGMQFAGRFNLTIHTETAILMNSLIHEYHTISIERIWTEWDKVFTKANFPSQSLKLLQKSGWITLYSPINNLVGCPQNPIHHPEGDVFIHTCHVMDTAAKIANRNQLNEKERRVLLLTALTHDFGKPSTTTHEPDGIKAIGHEAASVPLAHEFMRNIGTPQEYIDLVLPLVENHMQRNKEINNRFVRRLANKIAPATIQQLALVIEADMNGRPPKTYEVPQYLTDMVDIANELQIINNKPKPIIMGKHLIERGMKPGPEFKPILDDAFEAQMNGDFDNEITGVIWLENKLVSKK